MKTCRLLLLALAGLAPLSCQLLRRPVSEERTVAIVPTATRDQGGTAFCWAYALVAHLEQRFYETTRGESQGGFRLNFSEEYLGLVHFYRQLRAGTEVLEGWRLSDSLALLEDYGVMPETVAERPVFSVKFADQIASLVQDEARFYREDIRAC